MTKTKLSPLPSFPSLYEINTRPWLRVLGNGHQNFNILDVEDAVWQNLRDKGMDMIWLMGVWKNRADLAPKYCFKEGLLEEYGRALPDWTPDDVIGSPYAIDEYKINPLVGMRNSLKTLKARLNRMGLRLILDFVPNHFHAESRMIDKNPDAFIQANKALMTEDWLTYYSGPGNLILAHGKDPYFDAWQDTVQINIFHREGRQLLTGILLDLTEVCDGVRCDMAMLLLNGVFEKTWEKVLNINNIETPVAEFWEEAISTVKSKRQDFLFLAEAYWDLEWQLQQLGFDFTYDKRLRDRLLYENNYSIKGHLRAEMAFQKKSVRFLENHDETRAVSAFGKNRSLAAAMITYTVPGLRFFHDKQWEGWTKRTPVQLGRMHEEPYNSHVKAFYSQLLGLIDDPVFREGYWEVINVIADNEASESNIFSWKWQLDEEKIVVLTNYSERPVKCLVLEFGNRINVELAPYRSKVIKENSITDY